MGPAQAQRQPAPRLSARTWSCGIPSMASARLWLFPAAASVAGDCLVRHGRREKVHSASKSAQAGEVVRMYPKIAQLKDVAAFRDRLAELNLDLPVDDKILTAAEGSPLAQPLVIGGFTVGNRWCIIRWRAGTLIATVLPRSDTLRRWKHFGLSGAKLIWGGEAAAVQEDGRANPN